MPKNLDLSQINLLMEAYEGEGDTDPEDSFSSLVQEFYKDVQLKISAIRALQAHNGHAAFERLAHGLKGLSLNFGATTLGEECERLQRLSESEFKSTLETVPGELSRIFELTRLEMQSIMDRKGNGHEG